MGEEGVIVRRGLAKKHAAVDYEVWQWKTDLEQSRGAQRVTKSEVQSFAKDAYKKAGITNFKASDGWYRRWRVRWQLPNVVRTKDVTKKEDNSDEMKSLKPIPNHLKTSNEEHSLPRKKINRKQNFTINTWEKTENNGAKTNIKVSKSTNKSQHTSACKESLKLTTYVPDTFNTENKLFENLAEVFDFPNVLGLVRVHHEQQEPNCESNLLKNITSPVTKSIFVEQQSKPSASGTDFGSSHEICLNNSFNEENNVNETASSVNSTRVVGKLATDSDMEFRTNQGSPVSINESLSQSKTPSSQIIEINQFGDTIQEFSSSFDSQSTEVREHSNEHEPLWFLNSVTNNTNSNSQKSLFPSSQSDSGISLPSTSISLETSFSNNSPLDLDFGEHELFCDSCEDFHPWHKGSHTQCCQQNKDISTNSLLSGVIEEKVLSAVKISSDKYLDKTIKNVNCTKELEDFMLKNPSVALPKGKRYLLQFKSKVVNYALSHNVKQAVNKFNINRGTVAEWLAERKRYLGEGSSQHLVDESILSPDTEFLSWLETSKFNVTNDLLKQKASDWLISEEDNYKRCTWLHMYAHRLNGTTDSTIKKRYIAYPESFKRVVVFYAQTHSNMAAARVFGVARRRILEWQISSSGDSKEKSVTANNVTNEAVDKAVFEWYRSQDNPPSSKQVRCKAIELYRMAGHLSIQCGAQWYYRWRVRHKLPTPRSQLYNSVGLLSWALTQLDNNQCVTHKALAAQAALFTHSKVSRGWTFRFCRKHHKLLVEVPETTTPLPHALELSVVRYRRLLLEVISSSGYTDSHIIVMDEIPLQVLPKDNSKKPLLMRRSGFESCQASMVVSSLSDGTLLPSVFIFKGMIPSVRSEPEVIATCSTTGTITEDIMDLWLRQVCLKHLGKVGGVLITDCLNIHTTERVQKALKDHHVHHAVIPGGCAFKLLPLLQVCQMFKSMLEEMCHAELVSQTTTLQSPSVDQLYHWAVHIHKHLAKHQTENIKTAFREMLIATDLHHTS